MQFYIFCQTGYDFSIAVVRLKTLGIRATLCEASLQSVSSLRRVRIDVALIIGDDRTIATTVKFLRPSHLDAIIACAFDKENSVNLIIPEEANDYVTKEAFLDDSFTLKAQTWLELTRLRVAEAIELADGKNAFGVKVWDRRVRFKIQNEQSLELIWEYFLNDRRFEQIKHAASWVQVCYTICVKLLNEKIVPIVVFEENDDYFFLTITNIDDDIAPTFYEDLIEYSGVEKLRFVGHIYKKSKGVISIHLRKKIALVQDKPKTAQVKLYPSTGLQIDKATDYIKECGICADDLRELRELELELKESLEAIEENSKKALIYAEFFAGYAAAIGHLLEFEELQKAIDSLATALAARAECAAYDKALYFAETVREDLSLWLNHVFVLQDAQNIHYLDASLMGSCDYIKALIAGEHIDVNTELELF